jgi:hypothetical protein
MMKFLLVGWMVSLLDAHVGMGTPYVVGGSRNPDAGIGQVGQRSDNGATAVRYGSANRALSD